MEATFGQLLKDRSALSRPSKHMACTARVSWQSTIVRLMCRRVTLQLSLGLPAAEKRRFSTRSPDFTACLPAASTSTKRCYAVRENLKRTQDRIESLSFKMDHCFHGKLIWKMWLLDPSCRGVLRARSLTRKPAI